VKKKFFTDNVVRKKNLFLGELAKLQTLFLVVSSHLRDIRLPLQCTYVQTLSKLRRALRDKRPGRKVILQHDNARPHCPFDLGKI
jgi:hypothetical protein